MIRLLRPHIALTAAAVLHSAIIVSTALALPTPTLYWDVSADAPGPGIDGFYDGRWGTDPFWSTAPNGTALTGAWVPGGDAVFIAGADTFADGIITIQGTEVANSILIQEGTMHFRGGMADTGAGAVIVETGATLDINSTLRLNTTSGKVLLNGGGLRQTNPGQAGNFIGTAAGLKGLEINAFGTIEYDDGDLTPDSKVSLFFGVISGTGGTPTNGGAGTLIKAGPDQIGIQASNQPDPGK